MTPPDNRGGVRTWTLYCREQDGRDANIRVHEPKGSELGWGDKVEVIELEPVLDLLERWTTLGEPPAEAEWEQEVRDLLAAHNRGQSQGHCPHCGLEHMGALAEQACRDRAIEAAS